MTDPDRRPLRIALVEDESAFADAVRHSFAAARSRVEIAAVRTLKEFRDLVAASPPDIALMDLNLPDGLALEALTSPPEAGDFPVLLMTSHGNEQIAVDAIKAGALDYVVKSAAVLKELPQIVARVMREWNLLRERARTAEVLRASEEKYRGLSRQFHALLDAIPEEITVLTPELKVIWANRAAATRMGREPAALAGASCHLVRFQRSEPCRNCPVQASLRTLAPARTVKSIPAGMIYETRAIPVIEAGQVINVIDIVRDITEQTRMEEQLRQAQKMESVGTLAGGVAHDFNNILTSVIGAGHMARIKAGADAPVLPYIKQMLEGADRAAKLTDGLLTFSRAQCIAKKPFDIVAVVRGTGKAITRMIGEGVRCTMSLPEEQIRVLGDAAQLEQVLLNLAANARDAIPHGGVFTIAVELVRLEEAFVGAYDGGPPGTYVVISATDTGSGVPDGIRARIFEPFYTTKEVGKGTGLGLSIVHGIVKQHDGFIDLESAPGKGTTLRIFLPAIVSPEIRESAS